MAKLVTCKSYNRWPSIWMDPDSSKNRIFLDNFAFNYTNLSPRSMEIWHWQTRYNTYSTSADWDNYGPIQLNYIDSNAWAAGHNDLWAMMGLFDNWLLSLDLAAVKPTRVWRSALGYTIATYPRTSGTGDTQGDWWAGRDMTRRSISWRHTDTFYYVHLLEHSENITFTAASWSYSTTTITINQNNHGFFTGDYVTISGATSTTNPPNGLFPIASVPNANSFTVTVNTAPTGTAAGTVIVSGTAYRGWGIENEAQAAAIASNGCRVVVMYGHNYTYEDNSATAGVSRPTYTQLNLGGYKFFMGTDTSNIWFCRVEQISPATLSIYRYTLSAPFTETVVTSAQLPTGTLTSNVFPSLPSNIRHDSADRKVFYYAPFSTTDLAVLRVEWFKSNATIATTTCTETFAAGTTFSTYSAIPTSNNFNLFGINSYWQRGHQFTKNSVNYITFTVIDKFIYSSSARLPSVKSRTWLTFKIETDDSQLTFHSGISFLTANDFPLTWFPYNTDGDKIVIANAAGTGIYTFDTTEFNADSWSYAVVGGLTTVTVNKTSHGLVAGEIITTSGATSDTNAPNGVYRINTVTGINSFTFVVSANDSGALITGTAGGTMRVTTGWQPGYIASVRARGIGVDSQNRLWVTTRNPNLGRVDIHMFKENMPVRVDVALSNSLPGTTTRYVYQGTAISTNLVVNAYDFYNNRVASTVTLTANSRNMLFTNNTAVVQVTTSSSGSVSVPVTIVGPGQTQISASINL